VVHTSQRANRSLHAVAAWLVEHHPHQGRRRTGRLRRPVVWTGGAWVPVSCAPKTRLGC